MTGALPLLLCWLHSVPEAQATEITGWVSPQWGAIYRPQARPEDQFEYGMQMARVGFHFSGEPLENWSYVAYTVLGVDRIDAVTGVTPVDTDNDGTTDTISTTTSSAVASQVREATLRWTPLDILELRLGRMRIPFSSQAQSPDTALMFPQRSGPNDSFLKGTDLGGLLVAHVGEEHLVARIGAFNGTGVVAGTAPQRGVLYSARVDINPLGGFSLDESGPGIGPLRIGVGAGALYRPYTTFDSAGYEDVSVQDLRLSTSLRMAFLGLHIQAEGLYRQQTDSLTQRPVQTAGAYGQAGWYFPIGVEPAARVGWVSEDRSFSPREVQWVEVGVNYYPYRDEEPADRLKLTLLYLGEDRITEGEQAHGLSGALQLKF